MLAGSWEKLSMKASQTQCSAGATHLTNGLHVRKGDFLSVFWSSALLGAILIALRAGAVEKRFNVADFGAVGDCQTLSTTMLQQAIDTAGAAGGGIVIFPTGTFLSGSLQLRSGVTLQLNAGATLLGSRDAKDYLSPSANGDRTERGYHDLIHGQRLHNIAIRGAGTIDGNGDAFHDDKQWRPKNILLEECSDVLVDGVHMRAAGSWMQHYRLCTNVVIRRISVFNHVTFNNDGLDVDSCTNVRITDCRVESDDDGICLKSMSGVPCRNVKISGCVSSSHCNALKMGTESGGGFIDISIVNCTVFSPANSHKFYGSLRGMSGVALEMVDGGRLENVSVTDVKITGVDTPMFLRLGDRGRTYGRTERPAVGTFRKVLLKNITAENCSSRGCVIAGLPGHPIEDVLLENINLGFEGGGTAADTERSISEQPDAYPDAWRFGTLPAYGFYCRHVNGLRFDNVRLRTAAADQRHALMLDDAEDTSVRRLNVAGWPGAKALLRLVQARNVKIEGCVIRETADVLLQLEGDKTKNVVLEKSDTQLVKKISVAAPDVPMDAFVQKP
jgi:polygalacturonase